MKNYTNGYICGFTPDHTEIFSSLKCTWYLQFLFHYAWISSWPCIIKVLFLFSHWKQGIFAVCIVICRSTNCGATVGVVSLTILSLWCSINMIFKPCDGYIFGMYMIYLYICVITLDKLSVISLQYSFPFLTDSRVCRVGGFFVSDGTVNYHYDDLDLRCHWWRRGCRLGDVLFSFDKHVICTLTSLQYYYRISFLFSLKARGRRLTALSALVAPRIVSTTN